jgi:hypothetical protein
MVGTPLIHSTPAGGGGGVTDHGALTGLGDDDHPHYALADKSRPSPWVAAADLTARSLADIGTRDHHLATGLADDDHSQYALLAGRAGGQTVIGNTASGGHLTLQSTAHATRGYVRAQDDLQLLSDIIRDAAATDRIHLYAATPQIRLTGQLKVSNTLGLMGSDPLTYAAITITPTVSGNLYSLNIAPTTTFSGNNQMICGMYGSVLGQTTASRTNVSVYGLLFGANANTTGTASPTFANMVGIQASTAIGNYSTGTMTVTAMRGIDIWSYLENLGGGSLVITDYRMLNMADPASPYIRNLYGIAIDDCTAATGGTAPTCRILELGPTPYLRLLGSGSWTPTANQTPLYLAYGATPTLAQVRVYDDGTRKYLILV